MPSPIPTGATRSLSYSATIDLTTGAIGSVINNFPYGLSAGDNIGQCQGTSLDFAGWSLNVQGNNSNTNLECTFSIAACGSAANSPLAVMTVPSGSISVTVPTVLVSQGLFPLFDGQGSRQLAWIMQEQIQVGGAFSASMTFNGGTISVSGTVPNGHGYLLNPQGGHGCYASLFLDPGTQVTSATSSAVMTRTFMGQALEWPFMHTYTPLNAGLGSATVDLRSGISLSLTADTNYSGTGVGVNSSQQPTKQCTINGFINAMDEAYPSGMIGTEWSPPQTTPNWQAFNFGDTVSMDNANAGVFYWSSSHGISGTIATPVAVSQGDGVEARMNAASLASFNENGNPALNARQKPFNYLTLWQNTAYVLDPCTSLTHWVSTGNTTLVGGFVQVDSHLPPSMGGIDGEAQLQFLRVTPDPAVSEGYRYLEIDIEPNTSDDLELLIQIQGGSSFPALWQYKVQMGSHGSVTTVTIDLLAPYGAINNAASNAYSFSSRVLDSKQSGASYSEGPGWGIDRITNLFLFFPGSTGTYQIHAVRLNAMADARLTFLQSENFMAGTYNGAMEDFYKFFLADTDGKRSASIGDVNTFNQSTMISAGSGTFTAFINAINGWVATVAVNPLDASAWYFSSYLSCLAGAGFIWTGGSPPSTYYIDYDLTSNPTTIPYQGLATYAIFPPQCGDVTNSGAFSGPFVYYGAAILRQRTTGVAIDNAQQPIASETVTETSQPGGGAAGSGTTNSVGRFITGANYAPTIPTGRDVLASVQPASGTINFSNFARDTLRLAFLGIPSGGGEPDIVETIDGELFRVYIKSNDVYCNYSPSAGPAWTIFSQITSDGNWSNPAIAVDSQGIVEVRATQTITGVPSVYRMTSTSKAQNWGPIVGGSFTPELVIMAATQSKVRFDQDGNGLEMTFIPDSGTTGPGKFSARYQASGAGTWGSPFTPQNNSSSNLRSDGSGFGHDKGRSGDNLWRMSMVKDGDSTITEWQSGDGGESWIES